MRTLPDLWAVPSAGPRGAYSMPVGMFPRIEGADGRVAFDLSAYSNVPPALAQNAEDAQVAALLRRIEQARADLRVR